MLRRRGGSLRILMGGSRLGRPQGRRRGGALERTPGQGGARQRRRHRRGGSGCARGGALLRRLLGGRGLGGRRLLGGYAAREVAHADHRQTPTMSLITSAMIFSPTSFSRFE